MKGFERILVPLDFSEGSERVVGTALDVLAEGGTILLLHVVEWLPAVMEGTFGIYPHRQDIEKVKALSNQKLAEIAQQHASDGHVETLVGEGKPSTVILEAIAEHAPDVVVMGTHGRSRLDQWLIGSVTERVLRRAPCHVLTVRTGPREG